MPKMIRRVVWSIALVKMPDELMTVVGHDAIISTMTRFPQLYSIRLDDELVDFKS